MSASEHGVGILWRGPWSAGVAYEKNDAVSYEGSAFVAIAATKPGVPPTDPSSWQVLAEKGASGPAWKGAWQAQTYAANDAVGHKGSSYIASKPAAATDVPGASALWEVLASAGVSFDSIVWRGDWSTDAAYKKNDVVKSGAAVYVATSDPPKGTKPEDVKYWAVFVATASADAISIISVIAALISAGSAVGSVLVAGIGVAVQAYLVTTGGTAAVATALGTSAGAGGIAGAISGTGGGAIVGAIADAIKSNRGGIGDAVTEQMKNSPEFKQAQKDITDTKSAAKTAQDTADGASKAAKEAKEATQQAKAIAEEAKKAAEEVRSLADQATKVAGNAESVAKKASETATAVAKDPRFENVLRHLEKLELALGKIVPKPF